MGSFLQTCAITNQTVQEGQSVYIIPIVDNIERHTLTQIEVMGLSQSVYNTDVFKPVGFIFTGTYNDYGRYLIDWDSQANQELLKIYYEYLLDNALKVDQGKNKYHDVPFDLSTLPLTDNFEEVWDYIHEAIWEGRLYLLTGYGKKIYKRVSYNISIKKYTDILTNNYENIPLKYLSFIPRHVTNFNRLPLLERVDKYINDMAGLDLLALKEKYTSYSNIELSENRTVVANLNYYFTTNINTFGNIALYKTIYMMLYNLKNIINSMSLCNLTFKPVYYGSQDYGNEMGNRYAYLMELVAKDNVDKMMDDYSELTKRQANKIRKNMFLYK